MKKGMFLITLFFFGSMYSAENLPVALPAQSPDAALSNWGHEEFNSSLPDHLVHLIMEDATLGNKVSQLKLRTEKRKADPKLQVQAVEGMLEQRGYKPNSVDYQVFVDNLVDQYNESIQNHVKRLELAEEGFVEITPSMISLVEREDRERGEEVKRYNNLPLSTKFQRFAGSRVSSFAGNIKLNIDPETVKIVNKMIEDLRQLSITNPEQVVIDAMRNGVQYGLNILKNYIESIKQQQVKAIENKQ